MSVPLPVLSGTIVERTKSINSLTNQTEFLDSTALYSKSIDLEQPPLSACEENDSGIESKTEISQDSSRQIALPTKL